MAGFGAAPQGLFREKGGEQMDEKLSQSQIDELLRAFSSGDPADAIQAAPEPTKAAKEYDFRTPQKFSKEQLRSIELLYDTFARNLSNHLTGYLRVPTEISVASAEQVIFKEFSNTLVNPVIMSMINFHPLRGSIIMELSAHIGFAMIDRILGGPGMSIKKIREFSEIEVILLERLVNHMIGYLQEPWRNVVEITPRLERIETNAQFAQVIAPNETTALVTLEIKVGGLQGFLNFVIPHLVIEGYMANLNTRLWFTQRVADDDGEDYAGNLEEKLEKTVMPVKAIIGKTRITVGEFAALRVGDFITLDSYVDSDLIVSVGDLYKFKAKPGVSRGKNAIKITSLINEEELTGG